MKKSILLTLFAGSLGFMLGVLFAPKSGEDTRNLIKQKVDSTKKTANKKISDTVYDINSVKDTIKDTINLYTGNNIKEVEGQNIFEKEF